MSSEPSSEELATALADAETARALSGAAPALALGADGDLRSANAAALAFFGATGEADLAERLRTSADPGAKRLRQLLRLAEPGRPGRAEFLRFALPGGWDAARWRVWRTADAAGLLVAAREPAAARGGERPPSPASPSPGEEPRAPAAETPDATPGSSVRFVWRTDDRGALLTAGPAFRLLKGAESGVGRALFETAEICGADPDRTLRRAFETGRTWAKVRLLWPMSDGRAVPVVFGAAPAHSRGGGEEWRGFGMIEGVRPAPPVEVETPVVAAPAASPEETAAPRAADAVEGGFGPNVVALRRLQLVRPDPSRSDTPLEPSRSESAEEDEGGLTSTERSAFREIALALGARLAGAFFDRSAEIAEPSDESEAEPPVAALPVGMSAARPQNAPLSAAREPSEVGAPASADGVETRELRTLLDAAADELAVLDERGAVLSLNGPGCELFAVEPTDVAGASFASLLATESGKTATERFARLVSDARGAEPAFEAVGRGRRGEPVFLSVKYGRLGSSRWCAVLRDMTAWKQAERELEEARREAERASALKSEFLAKVSHEIRTPLNAILGFAEVIMDQRFGPVGNDRYREYLKDIHASGTHVMSLVNDLLDLSKIEAGKMELRFEPVDLNKIVAECVSLMQPQANSERVIVRLAIAPGLPPVLADERSIRQIVLNLLSNAVKFNEPGGQVIVSTASTEAGASVIRIRDTGIGMSDEDLATALEPFRQVQTSRRTSGTGLGLPLTKALVEANAALFTVKSRRAEGTLVEVVFPAARAIAS